MEIKVSVNIGTEGKNCWGCPYNDNIGRLCELFRVRLASCNFDQPRPRCPECLEAERKTKEENNGHKG